MKLCAVAIATALTAAPAALWACTPIDPNRTIFDNPVVIAADGSFDGASEDESVSFLRGNPVRDIGGGRTGQIIETNGGSCGLFQSLLFVDCTRGEAIMVNGIMPVTQPEDGMDVLESTRALQPPDGPLALTPATSVAEIAALARRQVWRFEGDVPGMIARMSPQNRYDPFIGCKIYYPGSAGALI